MNSYSNNNGRIVFNNDEYNISQNIFKIYDRIPVEECVTLREPTLGLWNETELSKAFFSYENIMILQNAIRKGVYDISNHQYLISNQDCNTLKIIMRSIFLQHSINNPTNITQQIKELNQLVVTYSVNNIFNEAIGYKKYLQDVSTLAVPLSTPIMTTQNDKTNYKMPSWF